MQYRQHRYPTQFPLELLTPRGTQKGKVLDVNNAGARLMGLRGVRRGDKLRLKVLSNQVEAVVHWVSDDRVGIAFRPEISNDQVDMLRYRPDGRAGQRRGQVGFAFAEWR